MKYETEIIFVRHGETDFNKAKLYFGHLDPELNNKGKEQLKKSEILLKNMENEIDVVFCSPLKRCVQSLDILNLDENIKKYYDDDFKEINFGIFEGKTYEEICQKYPKEVEEMKNNWKEFKVSEGESLIEVYNRCTNKIKEIVKKYKNKKILIVAHAGIIQCLFSYFMFENLDGYWKFKIDNGSISKITILEEGYVYSNYINRI